MTSKKVLNQSVVRDFHAFDSFIQPLFLKDGTEVELRLAHFDELPMVARVHQTVYQSLSPEHKTFVVQKSLSDFQTLLNEGGAVFVIVKENEVIATASVRLPSNEYPRTDMDAEFSALFKPEKCAVLQGAAVLPDYQGHGLQQDLIDARINMARAINRPHILSEVDLRNVASIRSLMKKGLCIKGIGVDPTDNAKVFNMHARIDRHNTDQSLKKAVPIIEEICVSDFENLSEKFKQGFKGIAVHKQGDAVTVTIRKTQKVPKTY